MQQPDEIVRSLQTLLDDDPSLADVLEKSLRSAAERAAKELDADVYDVLDWPRDLPPQYYDYLSRFVRWIPQQTDAPAWKKTSAPQERYAKEVSDRLAHFFWLVDQKADVSQAAIAENSPPKFRGCSPSSPESGGSFLDTTASFDDDILQSFLREAPEYTIEESLIDGRPNTPSGWLTFNQFFARELNAGLRPISAPADNRVVTSPADCSFRHCYDIDADSNIPATAVKGRHYGNITQLIDGSRFADTFFAGGTFVHYMLPPRLRITASTSRSRGQSRRPS